MLVECIEESTDAQNRSASMRRVWRISSCMVASIGRRSRIRISTPARAVLLAHAISYPFPCISTVPISSRLDGSSSMPGCIRQSLVSRRPRGPHPQLSRHPMRIMLWQSPAPRSARFAAFSHEMSAAARPINWRCRWAARPVLQPPPSAAAAQRAAPTNTPIKVPRARLSLALTRSLNAPPCLAPALVPGMACRGSRAGCRRR